MSLTREQIEKLEAGPELNAAVAEFVFNSPPGLHCHDRHLCQFDEGVADCEECKSFYANKPAPFSTDIALAWEAAEKSKIFHSYDNGGCEYVLSKRGSLWVIADLGNDMEIITFDESPEVAICRAALPWVLEQEESK